MSQQESNNDFFSYQGTISKKNYIINIHHDTDKGKDRRKGAGLEELQNTAALNATKAQDPRGNSGTHIGTEDNIDSLSEVHQPRVDKANDHNGGGRRALNNGSNAHTRQKACQLIGGEFAEQRAQSRARAALKRLSHQVHAKKEQAQTQNHFQ